jgi:hypothetical protein
MRSALIGHADPLTELPEIDTPAAARALEPDQYYRVLTSHARRVRTRRCHHRFQTSFRSGHGGSQYHGQRVRRLHIFPLDHQLL